MVLINLDSLSDDELRYIARQQGFEEWQSGDRDDIMDWLREEYEEVGSPEGRDVKVNAVRFFSALTDKIHTRDKEFDLPGIEDLPKEYNSVEIHMMLRSPLWAYSFWVVSPVMKQKLKKLKGSYFLRVEMTLNDGGARSSFDISITDSDQDWNIHLPRLGATYVVLLGYRCGEDEKILAQSTPVVTYRPYWSGRYGEMAGDERSFLLEFAPLISRDGKLESNPLIESVTETVVEEVRG